MQFLFTREIIQNERFECIIKLAANERAGVAGRQGRERGGWRLVYARGVAND